ncbi:hypothetical protein [Arthrobacter sp. SLBN-122]|uniref:hypothetical protein n=1 Tax=Arthrobacter sp. SLBN-122 TaxID=2768455 RepID=UPI0011520383|nr:hypothetical protein [Arthrobacter sp. SLBN-122]TQJ34720.1 hypothetical protein FBY36_1968 [Arthrobacter sp. SLBN-122]
MKSRLDAWAFLRPLLLALAAAASWIALSAAGASADSSASSDSLPGPSTVIAVPATVAHPARDVLEPVEAGLGGNLASAPASSIPTPDTTPPIHEAVEEVTGLVDEVVETLPVVDRMVPGATVPAVVNPVVGTVDGLVDGAAGTLVPLAGAALEPLDPVLDPVISAVPLPMAAPAGAPVGSPPVVTQVPQASGDAAPRPAEAAAEPEGTVPVSARATSSEILQRNGVACDAHLRPASATAVLSAAGPGDAPVDAPQEPAIPAVTTGGSSPSSGHGSTMPAWLGAYHFQIPAVGTAAVQARLLAVPAPVSFDPGSSPD